MRRRAVLTTAGAGLAGLAGCLTSSDDGTPTDTPGSTSTPTQTATSTATPTDTSTPTTDLSVSVNSLQPAIVELATPDSLGVFGGGSHQYLLLDVAVEDGPAPAKEELQVRFDGTTTGPMESRGVYYHYNHMNEEYTADRGQGWLLFELQPSGDASGAGLTWPGGTSEFEPALRKRMASPAPPMSMAVTVPDTVTVESTPILEFRLTNEGEIDGRFVAAVTRTGGGYASIPVGEVTPLVPAGDTTTVELDDTAAIRADGSGSDDEPDMTYDVRWTGEPVSRGVDIVSSS